MVKYGVTSEGFVKKSYPDIVSDMEESAKRVFGKDVDLTPGSTIKMNIDLFATELVGLWKSLQDTYYAAFITTASGYSVDNNAAFVGIERKQGFKATGEVTFFRNTILGTSSSKIIPSGTVIKTSGTYPIEFKTTKAVYFEPEISDEEYDVETDTKTYTTKNVVGSIESIEDGDGNDYTDDATFDGRQITLESTIPSGTTLYTTYKPLSVTAPIKSINTGEEANVTSGKINTLETTISFVHYIKNEVSATGGSNIESDAELKNRMINSFQSVGRATINALEYNIDKVSGVKNVIIESPYKITTSEDVTGDGTTSVYVSNTPLEVVDSVEGESSGTFTVDTFYTDTGEIKLDSSTSDGETITIDYKYSNPGNIKIFVDGGEVGDEKTSDTIVHAIETTRSAGIKSIGYGTDDSNAYGSDTATFSWFYRPDTAVIDVDITITLSSDSNFSEEYETEIIDKIKDEITSFINSLDMYDKIYKNKIIQIAIGQDDEIVNAVLNSWSLDGLSKSVDDTYIRGSETEIPTAGIINIDSVVEE